MMRRLGSLLRGSRDLKMVVLVRTDLGMGKGKACAQSAHAAVLGLEAARAGSAATQKLASQWLSVGQPKIVLRVGSHAEMSDLCSRADACGLVTAVVYDAGHTQLAPGTATVAAIGPGPADAIDALVGQLKLL